ncbi:MAG: hypothetical protein ABIH01_02890, partial [Candidatus Omnitrophota bacterium]
LTRSVQYEDSLRGGAIILDIKNAKPGVPVVPKPKSEAPKKKIEKNAPKPEGVKAPEPKEEAKNADEGLFHGEPIELPVGPLKKLWSWEPHTEKEEIPWVSERPGFKSFYKEGAGFKPFGKHFPYIGVAAGTEIVGEPNPVDDCILEAKHRAWTQKAQRRDVPRALFTRAFMGRLVFDHKTLPRLRYTYDDRMQLHEYEAEWGIKYQSYTTHAVDALYSFPPIFGKTIITVNPWYKRVKVKSKDDPNSVEDRDQYILSVSLADAGPLDLIYASVDYYEGKRTRTPWVSKPNQWAFKTEIRKSFDGPRLLFVPGWYYTRTRYRPAPDKLQKHELFVEIGKDFTDRIRTTLKPKFIYTKTEWPQDLAAGDMGSALTPGLTEVDAKVLELPLVLSYELFKDFDVRLNLEHNNGFSYKTFNNFGLGPEIELFKPGRVRLKFGAKYNNYYNLGKGIWTLYTKMYFAM